MIEEAITANDQLGLIEDWLFAMKKYSEDEMLSYGELNTIQSVYDMVKDF